MMAQPLAANTTYLLSDIPDYQFNINITGTDNNTYTFDNASLAAGIAKSFHHRNYPAVFRRFFILQYQQHHWQFPRRQCGFNNIDGSFLTTAPPGFLTAYPDAITDGYSFYVFGNNEGETTLAQGDYGSGIAPAPEPTTLALAGFGGLSLLLFRRRK